MKWHTLSIKILVCSFFTFFINSCSTSPHCDLTEYKNFDEFPKKEDLFGTYVYNQDTTFKMELKGGLETSNDTLRFEGKPFWLKEDNSNCNVSGTYSLSYIDKRTLIFEKEYRILCTFPAGLNDKFSEFGIVSTLILAKYKNKICLLLPKSKSQPTGCLGPFNYYVESCNFYIFEKE